MNTATIAHLEPDAKAALGPQNGSRRASRALSGHAVALQDVERDPMRRGQVSPRKMEALHDAEEVLIRTHQPSPTGIAYKLAAAAYAEANGNFDAATAVAWIGGGSVPKEFRLIASAYADMMELVREEGRSSDRRAAEAVLEAADPLDQLHEELDGLMDATAAEHEARQYDGPATQRQARIERLVSRLPANSLGGATLQLALAASALDMLNGSTFHTQEDHDAVVQEAARYVGSALAHLLRGQEPSEAVRFYGLTPDPDGFDAADWISRYEASGGLVSVNVDYSGLLLTGGAATSPLSAALAKIEARRDAVWQFATERAMRGDDPLVTATGAPRAVGPSTAEVLAVQSLEPAL